jgi:hypothetical protein
LKDAISRQDYFIELAEEGGMMAEDTNFAIHAIFLLGELRATESLPLVLETLSQSEVFIDFWFGDFMTGSLWEPIYRMGDKQLDLLKDFVLSPGIYTYARTEVCSTVIQIAHHQPDRKEEICAWFDDLLNIISQKIEKEDYVDISFSSLAVSDAVELHEQSMLPVIEVLFKQGYVDDLIYRSLDEIAEEIAAPPRPEDKRELMNIYDRYQQVVTTWAGYTEDDEESEDELWDDVKTGSGQAVEAHTPKIGRNDPCPCGSGKKYKKCCLNLNENK